MASSDCATPWSRRKSGRRSGQTRLRVVSGDISEERFGLCEAAFDGLSQRIDAVYHVASNVGLVLSYADIREPNALGLRSRA